MYGQCFRKVGQGVLELLNGNEKVTDRQTNRQTDLHVQAICPFEGGHKHVVLSLQAV